MTRREESNRLKELTGGNGLPPRTPSGEKFNQQEIDAIYLYASMTRNGVKWIIDEAKRKVGYKYQSSDAWCE